MEQHFRPSVADPGYDVVTENRFYVDRDGVEWEELSFSVNGSKWKEDRPAFPLLQPEKVLSVPLTLRLSNDYTYRLEGMSRLDDRDCYVVHFESGQEQQPLALSRHDLDRRRDIRPAQAAGGADEAVRAGRLQRGNALFRAGRPHRRARDRASGQDDQQADRARRRPQHAGREVDAVRGSSRQRRWLSRSAAVGAGEQSHHVPRHRTRRALLRQGSRRARRQRSIHDEREGDGDGRHARSVVRLPASDLRHQLSRFRFRRPRFAARAAVRRRARARQRAAAEAARHAARRQRRLLRDRRARQRQALYRHAANASSNAS